MTPLLVFALTVPGCTDRGRSASSRGAAASRAAQQRAGQRTALFNSIRSRMKSLPELTQMELTPPTVVLDARSTADGEDIKAVLARRPDAPDEPANLLIVPRSNTRFRGTVKPGDIVKYYIKADADTQARLNEGGGDVDIATYDAIDLFVAQVLRDDALLIQGGLPVEITQAAKVEIWRIADDRMDEISRQLGEYITRREPPVGWQPSPDESALEGLTERLNQWLRQNRLAGKKADASMWSRPGGLDQLPSELLENEKLKPYLQSEQLATGYFSEYEARQVQGAMWRRDTSVWARGGETSPLGIATALFDWTVRNIQLVEPSEVPPRWPWEVQLHGSGNAHGRAWVFAGLCEQQGVATAMVVVPTGNGERTLVGVLDGESLRLFDPTIGLPLPGTEPGAVASLAEAQADDGLLRQWDLPDAAYPLTAELLKSARVQAMATPLALSRRAAALQGKLTGEDALIVAVDLPAATERLAKAAGVESVSLWPGAFETLSAKLAAKPSQRRQAVREFLPYAWRPQLWKGRSLHFRGTRADADTKRDALAEETNDHRAAQQLYMNRSVRPADGRLARVPAEKREIYRATKTNATLFLGTLSYDERGYEVAKNWLGNSALEDDSAKASRPLVQYNLARVAEALGQPEEAIELLEAIKGPMAAGAKLRAKLIATEATAEKADSE